MCARVQNFFLSTKCLPSMQLQIAGFNSAQWLINVSCVPAWKNTDLISLALVHKYGIGLMELTV